MECLWITMILGQQHCEKTNLEMIIETSSVEEDHFKQRTKAGQKRFEARKP